MIFRPVKLEINWICRPMQKCMSNNWSHLTVSGNQTLPKLYHTHTTCCVCVYVSVPNFAWLSWSGNQTSALLINVLVACEKSINSFRLLYFFFYEISGILLLYFRCFFSCCSVSFFCSRERDIEREGGWVDLINTSIHQSSGLAEFSEAHYCA